MHIKVSDDIQLCIHETWPAKGEKKTYKTALVAVHGILEHGKNYQKLLDKVSSLGIPAFSFDLRGHGQSEGLPAYVESFDDYVNDLEVVLKQLKQQYGFSNYILFGHSMGGLISSLYVARSANSAKQFDIKGLVLSSPCFGFYSSIQTFLKTPLALLNVLLPRQYIKGLVNVNHLTHSESELKKIKEDCFRQKGITARLLHEFAGAVEKSKKIASQVTLPVYIFQAGADLLVCKKDVRQWYAELAGKKEYKEYPDFYHEIINEVNQKQVISDFVQSIKELV